MKTFRPFLLACAFAVLAAPAFAQTVSIAATDANAAETEAGLVPNTANIQISRTGSTASPLTVWV